MEEQLCNDGPCEGIPSSIVFTDCITEHSFCVVHGNWGPWTPWVDCGNLCALVSTLKRERSIKSYRVFFWLELF